MGIHSQFGQESAPMLRRRRAILTGDIPLSMEGHAAPGSMATDQSDSVSSSSLPATEAEPAPVARRAQLTHKFSDGAEGSPYPPHTLTAQQLRR